MRHRYRFSTLRAGTILLLACFIGLLVLQATHNHFIFTSGHDGSLSGLCSICQLLNSLACYEVTGLIILLIFLASILWLYTTATETTVFSYITIDSRGPPFSEPD